MAFTKVFTLFWIHFSKTPKNLKYLTATYKYGETLEFNAYQIHIESNQKLGKISAERISKF